MGYPGVLATPDSANFFCLSPGGVSRGRHGIHSGRKQPGVGQPSTSLSPFFRFGTAIPGVDSTFYPGEFIGKFGSGTPKFDYNFH